jgi:hypothetical protein
MSDAISRCRVGDEDDHGRSWMVVARGSLVVKALCYKPEGRGFGTRLSEFLNLPNPSGRTRP